MPRKKAKNKRRDELIDEHFHRIGTLVSVFLRKRPQFLHLRDDMESQASIKLVWTVDKFLRGEIKSLSGYLRLSIRSGIWDAVRSENVIQKPRHCTPRREFIDDHVNHNELPLGSLTSEDILELACVSASDRTIVNLFRENRKISTIAKATGQGELEVKEQAVQIWRRYRLMRPHE